MTLRQHNLHIQWAYPSDESELTVVRVVVDVEGAVLVVQPHETADGEPPWTLPWSAVLRDERIESAVRRTVQDQTGLTVSRLSRHLGSENLRTPAGGLARRHTFSVDALESSADIVLAPSQWRRFALFSAENFVPLEPEAHAELLRYLDLTQRT